MNSGGDLALSTAATSFKRLITNLQNGDTCILVEVKGWICCNTPGSGKGVGFPH